LTEVLFFSSIGSKIVKLEEHFGKMRQLSDILAVRTGKKHKKSNLINNQQVFLKIGTFISYNTIKVYQYELNSLDYFVHKIEKTAAVLIRFNG